MTKTVWLEEVAEDIECEIMIGTKSFDWCMNHVDEAMDRLGIADEEFWFWSYDVAIGESHACSGRYEVVKHCDVEDMLWLLVSDEADGSLYVVCPF